MGSGCFSSWSLHIFTFKCHCRFINNFDILIRSWFFKAPELPHMSICRRQTVQKRPNSVYTILSQTYNATLFLFDYFYVNAHALSKLFHSNNSSFNPESSHVLVLTICLKLAKKQ